MGAIQNQVNSLIGQVGILGAGVAHAAGQAKANKLAEQKTQAEIAETAEQKAGAIKNLKNDTIEAAEAIYAHSGDEGRTPGDFDPVVGGKKWSELSSEEKANLSENDINALADEVEKFRQGPLTKERIDRMEKAAEERDTAKADHDKYKKALEEDAGLKPKEFKEKYKMGKTAMRQKLRETNPAKKDRELKKAYAAFEELNDRIEATRTLRFNISAATEKINMLQTKRGGKK